LLVGSVVRAGGTSVKVVNAIKELVSPFVLDEDDRPERGVKPKSTPSDDCIPIDVELDFILKCDDCGSPIILVEAHDSLSLSCACWSDESVFPVATLDGYTLSWSLDLPEGWVP
jgi:hypothetical protein